MFRLTSFCAVFSAQSMAMDDSTAAVWYEEAESSLANSLKEKSVDEGAAYRQLSNHSAATNTTAAATTAAPTKTGAATHNVQVVGAVAFQAKLVAACDTSAKMNSAACAALKTAYTDGVCDGVVAAVGLNTKPAGTTCFGVINITRRRSLEETEAETEQVAADGNRQLQTTKMIAIAYNIKIPQPSAAAATALKSTVAATSTSTLGTQIGSAVTAKLTAVANGGSNLVCATCKTLVGVTATAPTVSVTTIDSSTWRVAVSSAVVAIATTTAVAFL